MNEQIIRERKTSGRVSIISTLIKTTVITLLLLVGLIEFHKTEVESAILDDLPVEYRPLSSEGEMANLTKSDVLVPVKVDMTALEGTSQLEQYITFGSVSRTYKLNQMKDKIPDKYPIYAHALNSAVPYSPILDRSFHFPRVVSYAKSSNKGPVGYSFFHYDGGDGPNYGGSGFGFPTASTTDPDTLLGSLSTRDLIKSKMKGYFVDSLDNPKKAIVFGEYGLNHGENDTAKYYVKVIIESLDNIGSVKFSMSVTSDEDRVIRPYYSVHMDIVGKHKTSEMKTLGDNQGIYFKEESLDLLDKSKYYVSFFTNKDDDYPERPTVPGAEVSDFKVIYTSNLDDAGYVAPINFFESLNGNLNSGYSTTRQDLPYGTVIPNYNILTGKPTKEKNGHPNWAFLYNALTIGKGKVGEVNIHGSVSDIPPISYTLPKATSSLTEDTVNVTINQSLDGDIVTPVFQPEYLDIFFAIDPILKTSITSDDIKVFLKKPNGDKTLLESSFYEFVGMEQIGEKTYQKIRILNDWQTNKGEDSFLYRNRKLTTTSVASEIEISLNTKFTKKHLEKLDETISTFYEENGEKNSNFKFTEFMLFGNQSKTNLVQKPEKVKEDKLSLIFPFRSNIYDGKVISNNNVGQNQININPLYFINNITPNFNWEKYTYTYTNASGVAMNLNTATLGKKTGYIKVNSPQLKGVSKIYPFTYTVVAEAKAEIVFSYVSESGKPLTPPTGYETSITGKLGDAFEFKFPNKIGKSQFKEIKKTITTPELLYTTDMEGINHISSFLSGKYTYELVYEETETEVVFNYYQLSKENNKTTRKIIKDLVNKVPLESLTSLIEVGTELSRILKPIQDETIKGYVYNRYSVVRTSNPNEIYEENTLPNYGVTINVYYEPSLVMSKLDDLSFGKQKISGQKERYSLSGKNSSAKLSVQNTYETNKGMENWSLKASFSGFTSSSDRLRANLCYQFGKENSVILNEEGIELLNNVNNSEKKVYFSDLDFYSESREKGLFVDVPRSVGSFGQYNGTLKFTVSNAK